MALRPYETVGNHEALREFLRDRFPTYLRKFLNDEVLASEARDLEAILKQEDVEERERIADLYDAMIFSGAIQLNPHTHHDIRSEQHIGHLLGKATFANRRGFQSTLGKPLGDNAHHMDHNIRIQPHVEDSGAYLLSEPLLYHAVRKNRGHEGMDALILFTVPTTGYEEAFIGAVAYEPITISQLDEPQEEGAILDYAGNVDVMSQNEEVAEENVKQFTHLRKRRHAPGRYVRPVIEYVQGPREKAYDRVFVFGPKAEDHTALLTALKKQGSLYLSDGWTPGTTYRKN